MGDASPRDEADLAERRRVVVEAAARGLRPQRRRRARNPDCRPDPAFDAIAGVSGSCRRILELVAQYPAPVILDGCVDNGMLDRTVTTLRRCRDALSAILASEDSRA